MLKVKCKIQNCKVLETNFIHRFLIAISFNGGNELDPNVLVFSARYEDTPLCTMPDSVKSYTCNLVR